MQLKRRKCRSCDKPALPNLSRCYDHYRQRQKELREASVSRLKARRAKKIARMKESLPYLKKEAWKVFSLYIRTGGGKLTYNYCFTCGVKKHYKKLQAGHYIHGKLDFDERNVHPQCPKCNKFLRGNLGIYAERLIEIGIDLKQLRKDAQIKGNAYSREELRSIIKKYSLETIPEEKNKTPLIK